MTERRQRGVHSLAMITLACSYINMSSMMSVIMSITFSCRRLRGARPRPKRPPDWLAARRAAPGLLTSPPPGLTGVGAANAKEARERNTKEVNFMMMEVMTRWCREWVGYRDLWSEQETRGRDSRELWIRGQLGESYAVEWEGLYSLWKETSKRIKCGGNGNPDVIDHASYQANGDKYYSGQFWT